VNLSALPRGRLELKGTFDQRRALFHAEQTEAGSLHGSLPQGLDIKSYAVVAYHQVQTLVQVFSQTSGVRRVQHSLEVHLRDREGLAHFVMELPRDVPPFGLLGFDEPAGQELEPVVGFLEPFLRSLPLADVLQTTDRAHQGAFPVPEWDDASQDGHAAMSLAYIPRV